MDLTPPPAEESGAIPGIVEPALRRMGSGCRRGHTGRSGPGEDPVLGQVPGRLATWFGAVVLAVVGGALWWWMPGVRPWLLAAVGSWYVVVLAVQALLGHRGTCLVRRTGRWFLGPVGAVLDPSSD